MIAGDATLFEPQVPARHAWGPIVKGVAATAMGHEPPAQVSGAAFPPLAIAQHEERYPVGAGAQAQPPTGGEIEQFGIALHLGDDGGNRPAGGGFLGGP